MIRAIVVGCGNFARGRLEALLQTNRFEVVALVDRWSQAIESAINQYKDSFSSPPKAFSTLEEAVAEVDADACFIVSASTHHAQMAAVSLQNNLHTMVIKPLALTAETGKTVLGLSIQRPDLVLAVGQNKRWNPASRRMQQLLQQSDEIGALLGGEFRFWIRQDLRLGERRIQPDGTHRGEFFFAAASHQMDQLVAAIGLPDRVTARTDRPVHAPHLGQVGVDGTAGGQALLDYGSFAISYTGTRAAHSDLADWSGVWSFRGTRGDFTRQNGEITVYRAGEKIAHETHQDLHAGLIEDDRLQYVTFADAIDGDDYARSYLSHSIDSWILALGCNLSATLGGEPVDLKALRDELWSGGRGNI